MAMEILLINQIEKHEYLYNFNLPEYNRKDMVEEAWADISTATNMSISDCKEKWRNIRSSFLRSMKPNGHKVKKPYYLTEYLKFIMPFLKPINNVDSADDSQYETQSNPNDTEIVVNFIKEEPTDGDNEDKNESENNENDNGILSDLLTRRAPIMRKRRRFVPAKKNCTQCEKDPFRLKNKTVNAALQRNFTTPLDIANTANNNNNALRMFLMSLLPELETMTADQVRIFKIKAMMLIDEIKVNCAQVRQNTTSINNDRLQKRLINLLLKNLQRTAKKS